MRVLEGLAELFAPTRCAGCEMPGALLCEPCRVALPAIAGPFACPVCGAPYGHLVCTECWNETLPFHAAVAFGELDGVLARAVVLHKDASERRLGHLLGGLLAEEVAARWGAWPQAVTWIPPTREALRRRGFDHARALAIPVAERIGVPCKPLLLRARARDQRSLGRSGRAVNAAGTFSCTADAPARVLVIDDVLTTGATLAAAASALRERHACEVRVGVVARAW